MLRSIADHILDIAQNSLKAGARNIRVRIEEVEDEYFKFVVEDDGTGMDEETLKSVFDPFFTTRDHRIRKVGLGLPFLKQITELTGGYTDVVSKPGKGTKVEALFNLKNVDCPPIGDLADVVSTLIFSSDDVNWIVERFKNGVKLYELNSDKLRIEYGKLLNTPSFMKLFRETLKELESLCEEGNNSEGEKSTESSTQHGENGNVHE